jgi:hypothetical protein
MAIAGPQIAAGGVSAPLAPNPHSNPRTTTDGFQGDEEVKDPTAAERQRRYRKRNARVTRDDDRNAPTVTRDGITLLYDRQDKIEIAFNDNGDALITQSCWPDEDHTILISRDNIPQFIDRLTDALGIPSFGGPR